MWGEVGTAEEDQLDAGQAKKVIRRAARMLQPYRRKVILAGVLILLWTGSILAGPFFVKYGIDQGISKGNARALNIAVAGYVIVAVASYFVYRGQVMIVGRVGEGFLRDLRIRVFNHLQRLSMPFYDRERAGVIVSRMTSDVDSLAELVQFGLLMFLMNTLLLVFSIIVLAVVSWQLLARLSDRGAVRGRGQHQVPARLEPRLPRGARTDRLHVVASARGPRRCPGDPGVRPRIGRDRPVRGRRTRTSTRPTWTRCSSRRGTCR